MHEWTAAEQCSNLLAANLNNFAPLRSLSRLVTLELGSYLYYRMLNSFEESDPVKNTELMINLLHNCVYLKYMSVPLE